MGQVGLEWTTDGVEIAAGRKKNWSGKRKMNEGRVDFATKIATTSGQSVWEPVWNF